MTEPNTFLTFNQGHQFTPLVLQANMTTHQMNTPTLPSMTALAEDLNRRLPPKRTYGAALTQALTESTVAKTEQADGGKTQAKMDDVYIGLVTRLLSSVDQDRKERIIKRLYADTFSDTMTLEAGESTLLKKREAKTAEKRPRNRV